MTGNVVSGTTFFSLKLQRRVQAIAFVVEVLQERTGQKESFPTIHLDLQQVMKSGSSTNSFPSLFTHGLCRDSTFTVVLGFIPQEAPNRNTVAHCQRLDRWLDDIGLEEFKDKFAGERFTYDSVAYVTETDLKAMGLPIGARRRILAKLT
ncbi:hypothetical protein WJX72_000089 [[Myrmecia] bisecta]|uniref:SAM domain-containing protein n=1 Tax=[Myrmecia] bisecta TaxID=41462 RepID=A0AAW1Q698_9CHLO